MVGRKQKQIQGERHFQRVYTGQWKWNTSQNSMNFGRRDMCMHLDWPRCSITSSWEVQINFLPIIIHVWLEMWTRKNTYGVDGKILEEGDTQKIYINLKRNRQYYRIHSFRGTFSVMRTQHCIDRKKCCRTFNKSCKNGMELRSGKYISKRKFSENFIELKWTLQNLQEGSGNEQDVIWIEVVMFSSVDNFKGL